MAVDKGKNNHSSAWVFMLAALFAYYVFPPFGDDVDVNFEPFGMLLLVAFFVGLILVKILRRIIF